MSATKQLLISNRRSVREAFGKTDQDAERDIEIIREWCKTQPHLPEVPSDNAIEMFLILNKFSIERAKPKIDMYYTIRSLMPEIFNYSNPLLPPMKDIPDIMASFTPLPKLTSGLQRVSIFKLVGNPEDFDIYKCFAYSLSVIEVRLQKDIFTEEIYIVDSQNLKMGHIAKVSPVHLKKMTIVLEKVFSNRMKNMHVLNHPPFIDIVLTILKGILKPKLLSRIKLHKSMEEVFEYVPKEIIPVDYGGEGPPLKELDDLWRKYLAEHSDRFQKLDKMRVNEDLRPTLLENDEILGYHGNFKKLDVD